MPKMKTHSGAKKRFRLTGSGHVKFKRAGMRHILASMFTMSSVCLSLHKECKNATR